MPRTNLREVLEAIAATPQGLNEEEAMALLDMHVGRVEACKKINRPSQLTKAYHEAEGALNATLELALSSKHVASRRLLLAKGLEVLSKDIVKAEAAVVEAARSRSDTERKQIKSQMMAELSKDKRKPVDLTELRRLVALEYARASAFDDVLKVAAANQIPVTPSPAKVSFADNNSEGASDWTGDVCEAAFRKYTWFELKNLRKSEGPVDPSILPADTKQDKVTDDVMWKLYQFRRHVIDGLIKQLHGEFPKSGLLFKSSGSEDIESDLDITVASSPPGDDVKAMSRFNAAIKTRFGRSPGRVFDTNLYARDYRAIEDNMTKAREGATPKDKDIAEPTGPMANMSRIDQDVATLMKQRRFLDEETFMAMWHQLRDSLKANGDGEKDLEKLKADRKLIEQRFEEAEAVYLLTAQEKVEAIRARVEEKRLAALKRSSSGKGELSHEEADAFKAFDDLKQAFERACSSRALVSAQILLPKFLDLLEEKFPDEVMEGTDDQYAQRMTDLREDQARLDAGGGSEDERNALKARIKQAQFTNIVFANEAYVSQGAIAHVVAGMQASTPEKKKEVLESIKPEELLQSTNEQLADFFKDMKHMEHAEKAAEGEPARRRATGQAFVHASKYLSRVLDAAAMLEAKYKDDEPRMAALTVPTYPLLTLAGVKSPEQLRDKIDVQLVKLRKSSTIPGDVKAELAVADVDVMFKVDSVDKLRKLIIQFSVEFNRRVRQLDVFEANQVVDREAEKQYFKAHTKTHETEQASEVETRKRAAATVVKPAA